jgi:lysophospholipase L1-like esterase
MPWRGVLAPPGRTEVGLIPCLVIGDSIAVGVGQTLPECRTEARVGITSQQFIHELLSPQQADKVVISLGVNDGPSAYTIPNLKRVRETVHGRTVFWLLPAHHDYARAAIRSVATQFGDRLIDCTPEAGPDGLHPTGAGYRTLGALIRAPGNRAG